MSNIDPTPAYPFGHGVGYTSFAWSDLSHAPTTTTDGSLAAELTVTNTGDRDGVEVVQLYLHDPVASVVRPEVRLIAFARVELVAGGSARVAFSIPADLAQFTGRDGRRVVEPGALELRFGASSSDIRLTAHVELTGPPRTVDVTRALHAEVTMR